jgi:outer membrane protein TolC
MLLSGVSVHGQISLDRDECREMAIEYSRRIKLSENQKKQAVLDQKVAKAAYFPEFNASGFYFYKPEPLEYSLDGGPLPTYTPDGQGGLQPNTMQNPATNEPVTSPDGNPVFNMYAMMPDINLNIGLEGVTMAGVSIDQPVYTGGKIRAANKMADTGIELAGINIYLKTSIVLAQTDAAYFNYISVKAKKQAACKYKILLDSLVSTIEAGMQEGMATRNDLLKAQVKRNDALLMLQKAESGLQLSRMNLCRVIGLPLETEISVEDATLTIAPSMNFSEKEEQSPELRPEYQILNKSIELEQYEEKMIRSEMLPQIGISAGYNYFGGLKLNGQSTNEMSFSALASVKVPIFNWSEKRNKLTKAKLATEAAQLELDETEKLLQLDIAQARFNLQDAATRLKLTSTALEQAEENLETCRDRYNEGMERLVNLLEAQAQWQDALSEKIEAQTSVKLMETMYLKATGQLSASQKQ